MKTCKGKNINLFTKILLAVAINSSLKQQLISASHLHTSTNLRTSEQPVPDSTNSQNSTTPNPNPNPTTSNSPTITSTSTSQKYSRITAQCDDKFMTITGQFVEPFRGRIYAVGYPDEAECGVTTVENTSENATFLLPLGQCGVQMRAVDDNLEKDLLHEVTVYIQYSAFLQQILDEKLSLSCTEQRRKPVENVEQTLEEDGGVRNSRRGRKLKDPGVKTGFPKIGTKIGEALMEIIPGKDPTPKSKKHEPVAVGEDVTLVISTKVNRGFDARIVNCTAHDGSRTGNEGYRAQQILDSAGCSVDKGLVPNFRRRRLAVETRNRLSTLHFATFPAFKFPERDHLHIKCSVAYCQGPCPQESCDSGQNHFGTWREKYGRISEVLVDSSDIVNSLEVLAPDLEDTGGHHYERHEQRIPNQQSPSSSSLSDSAGSSRQFSDSQQLFYTSGGSGGGGGGQGQGSGQGQGKWGSESEVGLSGSGSGNVCVSPGTVILALVILGIVLIISASVTLWFALKRSELKKLQMKQAFQHSPSPYYRFSQHW